MGGAEVGVGGGLQATPPPAGGTVDAITAGCTIKAVPKGGAPRDASGRQGAPLLARGGELPQPGRPVVQRQALYLGEINDGQRAAWCRSIEALCGGSDRKAVVLFPTDRETPELDCEVVRIELHVTLKNMARRARARTDAARHPEEALDDAASCPGRPCCVCGGIAAGAVLCYIYCDDILNWIMAEHDKN